MANKLFSLAGLTDIKDMGSTADMVVDNIYNQMNNLVPKKSLRDTYRQDSSTTTLTKTYQSVCKGWGQIVGNGTASISAVVSYNITFDDVPIILAFHAGSVVSGSAKTLLSDFVTDLQQVIGVYGVAPTTTQFTLYMRLPAGITFSAGSYYAYTWIAIGTKK